MLRTSLTPLLSSYRVRFPWLARPRGPHGVFLLLGLRREWNGQLQVHIDVDEGGERQEDHHQEVRAWRLFSGVGVGGRPQCRPREGQGVWDGRPVSDQSFAFEVLASRDTSDTIPCSVQ